MTRKVTKSEIDSTSQMAGVGGKKLPGALTAARRATAAKPEMTIPPKMLTPDQRYEMARKTAELRTARHAELDRLRNL